MSDGGKGDSTRPTDHKAFSENLEKVFGVKVPWYVRRDREQQAKKQGCEYCNHPMYAGTKCPSCGATKESS